MSRHVVLATDAASTYAVWAPIVARLWRRHGYTPLVYLHEEGWDTPFGALILAELDAAGARRAFFPSTGNLSIANTMRCCRLVGAAFELADDDLVLTADVDMVPIDGAFFARTEPFVMLRAMYHAWLASQTVIPPVIDLARFVPGSFRFAMCYAGATVEIWRELFHIQENDGTGALRRLVGDRPDSVDLDEYLLSNAFLSSPRAAGEVVHVSEEGVWTKGELTLIDPWTGPCLSYYKNLPRRLLRLDDLWMPSKGPPPAGAIDWIPYRFYPGSWPWWCFDAVAVFFPDEAPWLASYREALRPLLVHPPMPKGFGPA